MLGGAAHMSALQAQSFDQILVSRAVFTCSGSRKARQIPKASIGHCTSTYFRVSGLECWMGLDREGFVGRFGGAKANYSGLDRGSMGPRLSQIPR